MFVPPELREEKRFKEDITTFASFLPQMFSNFSIDIDQYIHLLYRGLVAKSAFAWFDHQNENVFTMLNLSYNIIQLQEIESGHFGKDLQLTATAIYFLYFVIGKLYPHLKMMESDIRDIFSEALAEMIDNFNPSSLQSRDQKRDQWSFMKLHNILSFIQGLQTGYVNPYNAYFPEIPDFMGPAPLDDIFKALPAIPMHDLPEPNRPDSPIHDLPDPDTPQSPLPPHNSTNIPDDAIASDRLYPDISTDKTRYKDTKLYPDLESDRNRVIFDMDAAYIDFMANIEGDEVIDDIESIPEYETDISDFENDDTVLYNDNENEEESVLDVEDVDVFNQGIVPNDYLSDVTAPPSLPASGYMSDVSSAIPPSFLSDITSAIPQTPPLSDDDDDYISDIDTVVDEPTINDYMSDISSAINAEVLPPPQRSRKRDPLTLHQHYREHRDGKRYWIKVGRREQKIELSIFTVKEIQNLCFIG